MKPKLTYVNERKVILTYICANCNVLFTREVETLDTLEDTVTVYDGRRLVHKCDHETAAPGSLVYGRYVKEIR